MNHLLERPSTRRIFAGVLFAFALLLNCLTPYVADDYNYRLSLLTKTVNRNLMDVAQSMYVHCFTMNGRVVSHTLEMIFLLMPKFVFNVCNAAVLTALVWGMSRVASCGRRHNVLLMAAVAMGLWYFTPAFGQVMLWQVGALNYLWGLLAGLALMVPYICRYVRGREFLPKTWMKVLFSILSIFIGMYTEITSFIAILLSLILLLWAIGEKKVTVKTWLWIPLILAVVGFLIMMEMPAETAAKQGDLTLETLLKNFNTATTMLETSLLKLGVAWAVLFTLGCWMKAEKERLVLSGVLTFGAVAANYMLIVASYYPERCMCTSTMLLLLSCAVLVPELMKTKGGVVCACGCAALTILFLFRLVPGTYDIYKTYVDFQARQEIIYEKIQEGETDLVLPCVHASTKYSAFAGTKDLDTEDAETWPNNAMAEYYGVEHIWGY
jgi:hypothetical protein